MKTNLPKKIERILHCCFNEYHVIRFVKEINDVNTIYVYIIVQDKQGKIYAAWNSLRLFSELDLRSYYSFDDAIAYINDAITIGR